MKLTAKIVSLWMAGTLVVVAAGTFWAVRHDERLLQADMRRDAGEMGQTLAPLIQDAWRASGEQRALQLIADANRNNRQLKVRWVWLDDGDSEAQPAQLSADELQMLRTGNLVSIENREASGHSYLHTYFPVPVNSTRPGAIELTNSLDGVDRIAHAALLRILALGAILVVLGAVAAAGLGVWLVGRPLQKLTDKTRSAGLGDLSHPVDFVRRDELAELGLSLNLMCNQLAAARERLRVETEGRIAALEQLRHADRLKTVGRLASGIAHELGTPMNVVLARAELIGLEATSETSIASVNVIKTQVQRMASMIRQLLDFGRRGRARKQSHNLDQLCKRTLQLLEPLARQQDVALELGRSGESVFVEVDSSQIQQVLTNIIENAVHAMPHGGTVKVCVEAGPFGTDGRERASASRCARVIVEDQGVGISPENVNHVFDPFFTTKEVGKGTGLGLSIAYGIVHDHGGWIDVNSTPNVGSRFSIYLPSAEPPAGGEKLVEGSDPDLRQVPEKVDDAVAKQASPST